uniref:tail completion protein gp17 n=1 Tax=Pseudomonas sp. UBA6323 TaxID=1947329 RepID=UPI0025E89A69
GSDYPGHAEVKRLNAAIETSLDGRPLTLADGPAFDVRVERMSTNRDADGLTYHGSVTVRVMTQQ